MSAVTTFDTADIYGGGAPQELLGLAAAVDVGGVEGRHPGHDRGVDDLLRPGLVDPPPEVVRAEPRERDLQLPDTAHQFAQAQPAPHPPHPEAGVAWACGPLDAPSP